MSARRWHRPSAFAVALALLAATLFVALGVWQLGRGREKQELLEAFDAAAREAPRDFMPQRDLAYRQYFPHVRVSGRFLTERGYLLDERVQDGKLGVHAIGIFAVDGEREL